ncbi:MAG: hypothetical protein IJR06_04375 [Paludibacteraceae bacterium]|nr:hypothetical protein [Paludibacteraceae bacterium]
MTSDTIIKRDWIVGVLDRDVQNIYRSMLLIAQRNIYISGKDLTAKRKRGGAIRRRTGALEDSLANPEYSINSNGAQFNVTAKIVLHERFLDMKRHGNKKIYNRQVWGILYNNALPDIKYNVGKEIADTVGSALKQAFNTK